MNEHYVVELCQKVLDQAMWCGSDELRKQGWCITSGTLENELFDYIREHELSEVEVKANNELRAITTKRVMEKIKAISEDL